MDKCPEPLICLTFWGFWAVDKPVDKCGQGVEKRRLPAENGRPSGCASGGKCSLQNTERIKIQNAEGVWHFFAGQKGYPHYPHWRNPPKVEEKTAENLGFSTVCTSYTQCYPLFLAAHAERAFFAYFAENAKIHTQNDYTTDGWKKEYLREKVTIYRR